VEFMAALGPDGSRPSLLAAAAAGELGNACVGNPLPKAFFARPAEQVAPDLIGCLLVKRQPSGELLWGVIVETEAYSQEEPACHGYRRRTPSNETQYIGLQVYTNEFAS